MPLVVVGDGLFGGFDFGLCCLGWWLIWMLVFLDCFDAITCVLFGWSVGFELLVCVAGNVG